MTVQDINKGRTSAPEPVDSQYTSPAGRGVKPPVQSVGTGPTGTAFTSVTGLFQTYQPLGYYLPWEILDYIELLARFNPDYSQAVANIKTLANSGHEVFVSAGSDLHQRRVAELVQEKSRTIQERSGGIDGLIDKLLYQAAVFGAMAGEWLLDADTLEVVDFADINPKLVRFFWNMDDGRWHPYQKVSAVQLEIAKLKGQNIINGCFRGDTRIMTSEGIREIGSLVGTSPKLLTQSRGWTESTISSFGVQRLFKMTVKRHGVTKDIYTTANHRWFTYKNQGHRDADRRTELLTSELEPGAELVSAWGKKNTSFEPSTFGIAAGIVFGDGTRSAQVDSPASVTLYGDKDAQLLKWFPNSPTHVVKERVSGRNKSGVEIGGIRVTNLPRSWKDLPSINESKSYLLGWLMGYFAADGCISTLGEGRLGSATREHLEFAQDVCCKLGFATNGIKSVMRAGMDRTGQLHEMFHLVFGAGALSEVFFLIEEHRLRYSDAGRKTSNWRVVSVEDTGVDEEVFCAQVPKWHAFALEDNILTGNCIELNELTFHYYAFDAGPNSPYGTPPFLAALEPLAIQKDMVVNMSQIVKKLGLLGIIDVAVKQLPIQPGEKPETYHARASAYLDELVVAVEDMVRDGGMVHYDDLETNTYNITGNAAGATNIFKQNEEQVFSGLNSMPSVQGRCVVPSTLVLTTELDWIPAGELQIGEELVAFDEDLGHGRGKGQVARLKRSVVEVNDRIVLPCVRVTTDQGSITVSKQHPMVAIDNPRGRHWKEAADLRIGDHLSWFGAPWREDRSYEAGYLAGMLDGEGTMGRGTQKVRKTAALRLAQLRGPVLEETERCFKQLGYTTSTLFKTQENGKEMGVVSLLGGRYETMRLLGSLRPHRFMPKSHECWEGAMLRNSGTSAVKHDDYVTVTAIEDVGELEVVALQTSSRTFIAEGLLNHNSYSTTETYAGVAYDIIIRNTVKYQRACKRMIESGYHLMSSMAGYNPDVIRIDFKSNKTLHRLQDAQSEAIELKNGLVKWSAGLIDQHGYAQEMGYATVAVPYTDVPESAILNNAGNINTGNTQEGDGKPTGGGKADNKNDSKSPSVAELELEELLEGTEGQA